MKTSNHHLAISYIFFLVFVQGHDYTPKQVTSLTKKYLKSNDSPLGRYTAHSNMFVLTFWSNAQPPFSGWLRLVQGMLKWLRRGYVSYIQWLQTFWPITATEREGKTDLEGTCKLCDTAGQCKVKSDTDLFMSTSVLTFSLLMWNIWWAANNSSTTNA
jgi:hypothetical protein